MIPENGPAMGGACEDGAMETVAAVLASETRPVLVLSPSGRLLHANPAAGAAVVAGWGDHLSGPLWEEARARALRQGAAAVARGGEGATLHPLALGGGPLFLLRIDGAGAEGRLARREGFLRRIAHDLRAPLQALTLLGDTIAGPEGAPDPEALAEAAAIAQSALENMNTLLEVSRGPEPGGAARQVFDIVALVRDLARIMAPICRTNGNRLETSLPEGAVWLTGQGHLVRAALQNLLSNAAKFTREGAIGVTLEVGSETAAKERRITLTVSDTGRGLPPEIRAWLERPDAPLATPPGADGFGLGLVIVAQALADLGARVTISGPPGTAFRLDFHLPAASAAEEPAQGADLRLDGLRLLVVEDNPVNLAVLLRSAANAGARVEGATNGPDALEMLLRRPGAFDLVLLDVNLPGFSGIEVLRRHAAQGGTGLPPVLGLTAHEDPALLAEARAAGMARVLVKPVMPSDLRRAIHGLWDRAGRAPAAPAGEADGVLDRRMVEELVEEMGPDIALGFMRKALEEARAVQQAARIAAPEALRPMIHSAVGSSGLTGLRGVERGLRGLQATVKAGMPPQSALELLDHAIRATDREIEILAMPGTP